MSIREEFEKKYHLYRINFCNSLESNEYFEKYSEFLESKIESMQEVIEAVENRIDVLIVRYIELMKRAEKYYKETNDFGQNILKVIYKDIIDELKEIIKYKETNK